MTKVQGVANEVDIAGQATRVRIASLDVFRGIVMAVMIFVNDESSVHGLSKWTYHMPADVDAMSYVDMVFPAFLFIAGMSLPIATAQRLRHDPSVPRLWAHIVRRSVSLVVLGLVLANAEAGDTSRMHLQPSLWALLALLGCVLLLAVYPKRYSRRWVRLLKGVGAALLVAMAIIYRSVGPAGHVHWLQFAYPEILGLIGLTYFASCVLYVPFRHQRWAPLAGALFMLALDCLLTFRHVNMDKVPIYVFPWTNGAMPCLMLAGVALSLVFLGPFRAATSRSKLLAAMAASGATLLTGLLLMPLGISKIRATPTWTLWTISACCALFALLYWVCDLKGWTRWTWLIWPAGANTLLTYLLPDVYFFTAGLFGFSGFLLRWNRGGAGVLRAVCFTVAILLISRVLTRSKLQLQL